MTTKKTPATPTPVTMTGQNKIVQDNLKVIYDQIKDLQVFAEFSHDKRARLEDKVDKINKDREEAALQLTRRIQDLKLALQSHNKKIDKLEDELEFLEYKLDSVSAFVVVLILACTGAFIIHILW